MKSRNFINVECRVPRPRAFTLVELLVVIGITAVMISVLLPVLSRTRRAANDVYCRSNLKQIALATRMYANDYWDHYPDGWTIGGASVRVLPGMKAPGDPAALPEIFGLPAVYKDRGYLNDVNVWRCPAALPEVAAWGNTYVWSVLGGTTVPDVTQPNKSNLARWTSLQRGREKNLLTYWVWDNFTTWPWTSGSRRSNGSSGTLALETRRYPHDFRSRSQPVGKQTGSINVLYMDGHVGVALYVRKPDAPDSIDTVKLRDPT